MLNILINYLSSCKIVFIAVFLSFIDNLGHFELFVSRGCFDCFGFDYDCWFVGEAVVYLGLERYGSRCGIGVRWVI